MIEIIVFLILLVLGYLIGSSREKAHYRSIIQREGLLKNIFLFEGRHIPNELAATGGQLVNGQVVISVDYFKRFVAGLRMLFGGRLTTYESLLDRGRREAVLRMKKRAKELDSDMIFNVKFETTSISKGQQGYIGSIEVYVYGSAIQAGNQGE